MTKLQLLEENRRLRERVAELEAAPAPKPQRLDPKQMSAYLCKTCGLHDPKGGAAPPLSRNWYCRHHLAEALDVRRAEVTP